MSNTSTGSQLLLTIQARANIHGLSIAQAYTLMAIDKDEPPTARYIARDTNKTFSKVEMDKLCKANLITWHRLNDGGRRPKVYSLTPYGARVLELIINGKVKHPDQPLPTRAPLMA